MITPAIIRWFFWDPTASPRCCVLAGVHHSHSPPPTISFSLNFVYFPPLRFLARALFLDPVSLPSIRFERYVRWCCGWNCSCGHFQADINKSRRGSPEIASALYQPPIPPASVRHLAALAPRLRPSTCGCSTSRDNEGLQTESGKCSLSSFRCPLHPVPRLPPADDQLSSTDRFPPTPQLSECRLICPA